MELNMGKKIISLRRERGMTQEQLAAALGVSGPAVSKWETGSSYPDITLLCPLARALGTDVDNLLTFEEELPSEKLGQYITEIVETARQGELLRAEEQLNALLHRYPSDMPLKFSAIGALSFFEMNLEVYCDKDGAGGKQGEKEKQRFRKQKKELAQALYDDGNPAFYPSSVSVLISMALAEGKLEEAEKLLKENLSNTADFTSFWVQLHLQKGERDQALGILQRQAYKLVCDLRTCLICLMREDIGLEQDRAVGICEILEQMDNLFSVGGNMSPGLFAEIYLRAGQQEKALDCLEQLVDRVTVQMDPPNPLVFSPAVAPEPEKLVWSREMKLAILRGLEKDACFEPLRGLQRFQALVHKAKKTAEE